MKICELIGFGGTLEEEIQDQELILNGLKSVLENIKKEYNYEGNIEKEKFEGMCINEVMKLSKGNINPIKVICKINEIMKNF